MPPPNEQTPLIQTVVITPVRPRYSHSLLRRVCTIVLAVCLVTVLILFLIPGDWLPGDRGREGWFPRHRDGSSYSLTFPSKDWPDSEGLAFRDLKKVLLETPSEDKARQWSEYYTAGPHLAGKNLSQALWTKDRWEEWGVKSSIAEYDVYINYPVGHRLALLQAIDDGKDKQATAVVEVRTKRHKGGYEVIFECKLEEEVLEEDPTTGLDNRIPTFHGYSASGNVTARYVYVNRGTYQDFDDLVKANVSLKGNIAVARYGSIFRGLKVKRAQELGMVGVVLYTDPQEDGEITEENGYKTYPDGPARNPSSVQRGSTQFLSECHFVSPHESLLTIQA